MTQLRIVSAPPQNGLIDLPTTELATGSNTVALGRVWPTIVGFAAVALGGFALVRWYKTRAMQGSSTRSR